MLPVSARFLAAVTSSHRMVARARVITPGATGADPPGVDLPLIDGSVTLDSTADIRGSLDLTVASAWPSGTSTADLVPYGTEIAVSRGVVYGNTAVERVALGIFRVNTVEQPEAPDGPLRITGQDRTAGLVDARLLAPVQYLAIQPLIDVLTDLVHAVYPTVPVLWTGGGSSSAPLGRAQLVEADRWAFIRDLVTGAGKVARFDDQGRFVVADVPTTTTPVWTVAGGAAGVLVSASRGRSRDSVYNAVAAAGEALDDATPAYGQAVDDDPTSVTWWDGPFGKVPRFFSSPVLTTNAQAAAAAASLLAQSKGLPYSLDFTAVPNPALEPLDVVQIVVPARPGRGEVRETHVLERVTIPLTAGGTLSASTRLQTTTGSGAG